MAEQMGSNLRLSVVIPCFNEGLVICETHSRLSVVLRKITSDYELIFVNDGSADDTRTKLNLLAASDPRVRVVNLSRNFGHQIAITAGLDRADGDAVVIIDADLQDPPHVIEGMVSKWREGFEVVYGKRVHRSGETIFKLLCANFFYRVLNKLSDVSIPQNVGDFRLLDRKVVEAVRAMREQNRFLRGMASWAGFRQFAFEYRRDPRFAGETKYPLKKLLRLASDGIFSFSVAPLRAAIWTGAGTALFALLGIVYAITLRLFTDIWVPGWTLLVVSVFLLGGVQLLFLGVIGEYVGRIFGEVKARPLYFVTEAVGFDTSGHGDVVHLREVRDAVDRPTPVDAELKVHAVD
jgi:dolichol-phosphate mannosyltransferase